LNLIQGLTMEARRGKIFKLKGREKGVGGNKVSRNAAICAGGRRQQKRSYYKRPRKSTERVKWAKLATTTGFQSGDICS